MHLVLNLPTTAATEARRHRTTATGTRDPRQGQATATGHHHHRRGTRHLRRKEDIRHGVCNSMPLGQTARANTGNRVWRTSGPTFADAELRAWRAGPVPVPVL